MTQTNSFPVEGLHQSINININTRWLQFHRQAMDGSVKHTLFLCSSVLLILIFSLLNQHFLDFLFYSSSSSPHIFYNGSNSNISTATTVSCCTFYDLRFLCSNSSRSGCFFFYLHISPKCLMGGVWLFLLCH